MPHVIAQAPSLTPLASSFAVMVGLIAFGLQHFIQLFDFWLSIPLRRRFDRRFARFQPRFVTKAGSQGPTFEDYKRCFFGLISFALGLVIAWFMPPSLRALEAAGVIVVGQLPTVGDVLLTAIVFASGTEGANTVMKYAGAVKSARQFSVAAFGNSLPISLDSAPAAAYGGAFYYHGGDILSNVEVVALYWGGAWQSDPSLGQIRTDFEAFLRDYLPNVLPNMLSAYSGVSGSPRIGSGQLVASHSVGDDSLVVPDIDRKNDLGVPSSIWPTLEQLVEEKSIHCNENTLFCILMPPNTQVIFGKSASGTNNFYAYHNWTDQQWCYSVIVYPCPDDRNKLPRPIDDFTFRASHEICESVTDPFGTGWTSNGREVCDRCTTPVAVGPYQVCAVANIDGTC